MNENEVTEILKEIEGTPYTEVSKQQLYIWGSKLLRASLVLGEHSLEAEQTYNQTIIGYVEDGKSVSESTTRAKASVSYELKQKYDLYFSTAKEAMHFIDQLNKNNACECQTHS